MKYDTTIFEKHITFCIMIPYSETERRKIIRRKQHTTIRNIKHVVVKWGPLL